MGFMAIKKLTLQLSVICSYILLISCDSQYVGKQRNDLNIKIVDSLGVHKAYQQLCWDMYCLYYRDTLQAVTLKQLKKYLLPEKYKATTLGTLPIGILHYQVMPTDTLSLTIAFYYNDSVIHNYDEKSFDHTIIYGAHISISGDSIIQYILYGCGMNYIPRNTIIQLDTLNNSAYELEVKAYLQDTSTPVNPAFYQYAIEKRLIK